MQEGGRGGGRVWRPNIIYEVNKSSEKMYVCKEDKESLTKSKINLITQLFKYLLSLDDSSLKRHLSKL